MPNIKMRKPRVAIIHIYLGQLPDWFGVFIKSCTSLPAFDFLIFSDQTLKKELQQNIHLNLFTKKDLTQLFEQKLNRSIALHDAYKICDFKPLFGKLFEDYLTNYDYWGYCDNDLIFGNLSGSLQKAFTNRYDIISLYGGYLSGPFCLFRNSPQINNLFRESECIEKIYRSDDYCGFDEHIVQPAVAPSWLTRAVSLLSYFASFPFFKTMCLAEIRYQYQWFYKKQWNNRRKLLDITDSVIRHTKSGSLRSCFIELIDSDRKYKRLGKSSWKLKFEKGNLIDAHSGKPVPVFHFIDLKRKPVNWQIPDGTDSFYLTYNGIEIG